MMSFLSTRPFRRGLAYIGALCIGVTLSFAPTAQAQVNVNLSGFGSMSNKFPIVVADFAGINGTEIANIIAADLTRSGQFDVKRVGVMSTDSSGTPNWAALAEAGGGQNVVYGSVSGTTVHYNLGDTAQQTNLQSLDVSDENMRRQAHKVADAVYEQSTGVRGIFATKIAYVTGSTLFVADADGENAQAVASGSSIISPAWSPDGSRIAYVSFETGKPVVYVQNLSTGARQTIANFKGNNSAPAWSPDGSQLAIALSMDALSNIYIINSNGGSPRKVTNSPEIDTEPFFFPNGSGLIFTSDRGGSPQIYRTGLGGGEASRITFNGSQNVSGKISPDGSKLVYTSMRGGGYSIAITGLGSGSDQLLTSGPNDLSPSFAPNGMQVLYVSGGRLGLVNADGSFSTTLPSGGGVTAAAWGPFRQ
ncbi:Tol-Pal system beta propeller repeat protein TolB [Pelistega europaea]|uniref:Tol-Pal system protein TolB n=1 Tax=Pelistega europaea TaxID=106147 RepID=A0A7Y4L896_9BURK|nr:Tol-Pal system beta propeller repeat protein TolB [Pelistega europaea]NOL48815.1 Tol-Pal system beta propeller repeat protein TolB [Pelistega europaea]